MKKRLTALALAASALLAGAVPASAASLETQVDCLDIFASSVCDDIGGEWGELLAGTATAADARTVAHAVTVALPRTAGATQCEMIFSDQVCDQIGRVFDIAERPVPFILGAVTLVLEVVRDLGDDAVGQIVCAIDPNTCPTP